MRAVLWGLATFFAFIAACLCATILPALTWTAVALFCYVRMVLASRWLSKKCIPEQAKSPRSLGNIIGACFSLGTTGLVWGELLTLQPDWQPPRREEFHTVTGELQVRNEQYVVTTLARPVTPTCYRPRGRYLGRGSGPFGQSCLPENIQNYVGQQVTILVQEPLEDKWKAVFYELSSGDDVLVSYDDTREYMIWGRERSRGRAAFIAPLWTLLFVPLMIFQWIGYYRTRRKQAVTSSASPAPEVSALK